MWRDATATEQHSETGTVGHAVAPRSVTVGGRSGALGARGSPWVTYLLNLAICPRRADFAGLKRSTRVIVRPREAPRTCRAAPVVLSCSPCSLHNWRHRSTDRIPRALSPLESRPRPGTATTKCVGPPPYEIGHIPINVDSSEV